MAASQNEVNRSNFPKDFIFGAGTSAYQVEGAWDADGKGVNNWDNMTEKYPESIADRSNGKVAADHYNKFKEDVALLKKVGLNSYRFSISWSRILPGGKRSRDKRNGGVCEEGIKYYNDLIDALLAEGIKPCPTLFHWDVPQCLEDEYGGFLDRHIVEHFGEFAEICFQRFGDRVESWITLNEPWSFTYCGYVVARFPPRRGYVLETSSGLLKQMLEQVLHQLPSSKGDPVTEIVDKASNLRNVTSSEGCTVSQGYVLETSWGSLEKQMLERVLRSAILDHRSALNVHRLTSSKGDPVTEIVDKVCNLRNVTSSEVCAVRDLIAKVMASISHNLTPDKGDPGTEPYKVAHNLILAHARAVNIYRKKYQERQKGKIGMTNVSVWYYPLDEKIPEDVNAASRAIDFMLGWFVAPVITGYYPPSMRDNVGERLPKFTPDEVKLVKGSCDFLGINYYTARYAQNVPQKTSITHYQNDLHVVQHTHRHEEPIGPRGGSSWLYIHPDGIYNIMLHIQKTYNNPEIFITENGVDELNKKDLTISKACDDETRINYHKEHLTALRKAIDKGVNLKGYFIWSFLDNFEWDSGYNVRFGIYYVHFKDGGLKRHPKNSATWWTNFLKNTQGNKVTLESHDVNTEGEGHSPA